jgi:dihydroorotate dehydrogenase
MSLYRAIRPVLFGLNAERAHRLSIEAAKAGLLPTSVHGDPRLAIKLCGLNFANPLGLAAGYDKGGEVPDTMWKAGFGHVEIGTVTPRPQPGNPRPRVFRLTEDYAVINRYGFNSEGADLVAQRLARLSKRAGVLGINIGANKESEDFAADYEAGVRRFAPMADYLTVNISSPNTPGLRGLQATAPLSDLLLRVADARGDAAVPIFVKIAPDLDADAISAIADVLKASTMNALIVSNTTLSRDGLRSAHRGEAGGLSGAPLFERSTIVLARMVEALEGAMPVIGVGGVGSAQQALAKMQAGASLVQFYTALVYEGPGLADAIAKGFSHHCDAENLASINDIVGTETADWAGRAL